MPSRPVSTWAAVVAPAHSATAISDKPGACRRISYAANAGPCLEPQIDQSFDVATCNLQWSASGSKSLSLCNRVALCLEGNRRDHTVYRFADGDSFASERPVEIGRVDEYCLAHGQVEERREGDRRVGLASQASFNAKAAVCASLFSQPFTGLVLSGPQGRWCRSLERGVDDLLDKMAHADALLSTGFPYGPKPLTPLRSFAPARPLGDPPINDTKTQGALRDVVGRFDVGAGDKGEVVFV